MRITAKFSENLPGEQYKTRHWSVELTQEIPDNSDIHAATRTLMEKAKQTVIAEIRLVQGEQSFGILPKPQQNQFSNPNAGRQASAKQISFLKSLSRKAGLTLEQVDALPQQYYQKPNLESLSSQEISNLIQNFTSGNSKAA